MSTHQHSNHIFPNHIDDEGPGVSMEDFIEACTKNHDILRAVESCLLTTIELNTDDAKSRDLKSFGHQAAGHGGENGLLKEGNTILKQYSDAEFEFYEDLQRQDEEVKKYFPDYLGRTRVQNSGNVDHYIILEDLTAGLEKPCIMDLKMGRSTFQPNAPRKKRVEQSALDKYSTSDTLGFRICGMRIYQNREAEYKVRDKPWGISVTSSNMESSLKQFIHNGLRIRYELYEAFLPLIEEVLAFFQTQSLYKFYGSSLLFVYDGASEEPVVRLRMVDFAHTVRVSDGTLDESYIFGLQTLESLISSIIYEGHVHSDAPHNFKLSHFPKPTICKFCNNFIWGPVTKQGYRCRGCSYPAHRHCYHLVPNHCTPNLLNVSKKKRKRSSKNLLK
eukprot:TRINITY_DN5497_c0_g1_i1.p1 TRINITY_DN5497_c0_g1~~TRINITY_DN5497_c0_g1_i1.p1  ORF type:complete len:389 (-),score=70.12 TRINITY_DN5497_c0_g1_i1:33-1199(-)